MSLFLKNLPQSFFRTVVSSRPIFDKTKSLFSSIAINANRPVSLSRPTLTPIDHGHSFYLSTSAVHERRRHNITPIRYASKKPDKRPDSKKTDKKPPKKSPSGELKGAGGAVICKVEKGVMQCTVDCDKLKKSDKCSDKKPPVKKQSSTCSAKAEPPKDEDKCKSSKSDTTAKGKKNLHKSPKKSKRKEHHFEKINAKDLAGTWVSKKCIKYDFSSPGAPAEKDETTPVRLEDDRGTGSAANEQNPILQPLLQSTDQTKNKPSKANMCTKHNKGADGDGEKKDCVSVSVTVMVPEKGKPKVSVATSNKKTPKQLAAKKSPCKKSPKKKEAGKKTSKKACTPCTSKKPPKPKADECQDDGPRHGKTTKLMISAADANECMMKLEKLCKELEKTVSRAGNVGQKSGTGECQPSPKLDATLPKPKEQKTDFIDGTKEFVKSVCDGIFPKDKKTPSKTKTNADASCKKKEENEFCKKVEKDPCKKEEKDPCKKEEKDPCKKEEKDPCKKEEKDPCKKEEKDPCKKEEKDPCKKEEKDLCKKEEKDPCKKEKKDPCKKEEKDPCKKEEKDPCKKESKTKSAKTCPKIAAPPCDGKKAAKKESKSSCDKQKDAKKPSKDCVKKDKKPAKKPQKKAEKKPSTKVCETVDRKDRKMICTDDPDRDPKNKGKKCPEKGKKVQKKGSKTCAKAGKRKSEPKVACSKSKGKVNKAKATKSEPKLKDVCSKTSMTAKSKEKVDCKKKKSGSIEPCKKEDTITGKKSKASLKKCESKKSVGKKSSKTCGKQVKKSDSKKSVEKKRWKTCDTQKKESEKSPLDDCLKKCKQTEQKQKNDEKCSAKKPSKTDCSKPAKPAKDKCEKPKKEECQNEYTKEDLLKMLEECRKLREQQSKCKKGPPDQSPIMQCIALCKKKIKANEPQKGKGVPPRDKVPVCEDKQVFKKLVPYNEAKAIKPFVPCKHEEIKPGIRQEGGDKKEPCDKKEDPCKEVKKEDPCKEVKKEDSCETHVKPFVPCQHEEIKPGIRNKKEDPCEKKEEDPCEEEKEDPCEKKKEDPCEKKSRCEVSPPFKGGKKCPKFRNPCEDLMKKSKKPICKCPEEEKSSDPCEELKKIAAICKCPEEEKSKECDTVENECEKKQKCENEEEKNECEEKKKDPCQVLEDICSKKKKNDCE